MSALGKLRLGGTCVAGALVASLTGTWATNEAAGAIPPLALSHPVEVPGPQPSDLAPPPVPITLLIANQKTTAPRTTDGSRGRKRRTEMALRGREDVNFANRTKFLASRVGSGTTFKSKLELAAVKTGAEFLASLISASQKGPIANIVIYGHAAPNALYMIEDRGFYADVKDVARRTSLVKGTLTEKERKLRTTGARDLKDLELLIEIGAVVFAENATIIFTGCDTAGEMGVEIRGIASRVAELTGATVFASAGATDQSMTKRFGPSRYEYSRNSWVLFPKGLAPRVLRKRTLDVFETLKWERSKKENKLPVKRTVTPAVRRHCASEEVQAFGSLASVCAWRFGTEARAPL